MQRKKPSNKIIRILGFIIISFESESEVAQSCPTLCDPMDCSLPGSSLHGILQARVLEWVAISSSRGSSQPRDQTRVSHIPGIKVFSNKLVVFIRWPKYCSFSFSISPSNEYLELEDLNWFDPFSSPPQSFPASGAFPMGQLFTSGGQIIGASGSVLLKYFLNPRFYDFVT